VNPSKEVDEHAEKSERQKRAVILRLEGRTYTDICRTLGYDNRDQVRDDVTEFMSRLAEQTHMEHEWGE